MWLQVSHRGARHSHGHSATTSVLQPTQRSFCYRFLYTHTMGETEQTSNSSALSVHSVCNSITLCFANTGSNRISYKCPCRTGGVCLSAVQVLCWHEYTILLTAMEFSLTLPHTCTYSCFMWMRGLSHFWLEVYTTDIYHPQPIKAKRHEGRVKLSFNLL